MLTPNNLQNHARLCRERRRPACNERAVALIVAFIGLMSVATLLLGPARPTSAQTVAANWSYTGNLNTARWAHTATRLPSGMVLVAGGFNYGLVGSSAIGTLNSAELYNPAT